MYCFNVPLTFVIQTDDICLLLIELYNKENNEVWRKECISDQKQKKFMDCPY